MTTTIRKSIERGQFVSDLLTIVQNKVELFEGMEINTYNYYIASFDNQIEADIIKTKLDAGVQSLSASNGIIIKFRLLNIRNRCYLVLILNHTLPLYETKEMKDQSNCINVSTNNNLPGYYFIDQNIYLD